MIDLILKVLNDNNISEYIINEDKKETYELYMIKKNIDMNRMKDIKIYTVTVFKNNEGNLKGSSVVKIYPSMDEEEVSEVIKDAYYAAGFVKNKYYELPCGYKGSKVSIDTELSKLELEEAADKVRKALYKYDDFKYGCINSSEIFVSRINKRIITSNDVDASYEKYKISGEFVAQWSENSDVEIFNMFSYDELKENDISEMAKEALLAAEYRDKSVSAPKTGKYDVMLSDSSVIEFFKYYIMNSKSDMIYKKYSAFKVNDNIQGDNIKGDKVSIKLKSSVPFSNEGIELKDLNIIDEGILKAIHGPYNFAQYLGINIHGDFDEAEIQGGHASEDDMFTDGTLKIIKFSDFQMDEITGDCFGEIRLALLKQKDKIIPLTGGSVTINIKDVQNNMKLSEKMQEYEGTLAPKYIKFINIDVAGK